jgi:hypothetical protein
MGSPSVLGSPGKKAREESLRLSLLSVDGDRVSKSLLPPARFAVIIKGDGGSNPPGRMDAWTMI